MPELAASLCESLALRENISYEEAKGIFKNEICKLMNVLSALDWPKNIYTQKNEYPYEIVQIFGTNTPTDIPYRDDNENIIIEVNDIMQLLDLLFEFEYHMISSYIQIFTRCISRVWEKTSVDGAFSAYNKYLNILLDIIINYEYSKMPPRLFQITAKALDRGLAYVGFCYGR